MNCFSLMSVCAQKAESGAAALEGIGYRTCGRICRLGPALTTLVVCIIGIALAIIYKKNLWTTPFAAGSSASIYLAYQSWNYGNLQSLEKSADSLAKENKAYKELNEQMQLDNSEMKQIIAQINEENERYQQLNSEQTSLIESLNSVETEFKKLFSEGDVLQKAQNGNFEQLQAALSSLKESTHTHQTFFNSLQQLIALIDQKVLSDSIQSLNLQLAGLKSARLELEQQVLNLRTHCNKLGEEINRLSREIDRSASVNTQGSNLGGNGEL